MARAKYPAKEHRSTTRFSKLQSKLKSQKLWVWIVLTVLVIWTLLPFVWTVSSAFKPTMEIFRSPPTIIPQEPTLSGFREAMSYRGFWRFWANTIFVAGSTTIIVMFFATLGGYAFAKYTFWLRGLMLLFILVPRILPRAGLVVPLYVRFNELGLLNTYSALIIAYVASGVPLATWVLAGAFSAVPSELGDAATVDGANFWRQMWNVYLPVALPGVITAATLTLVDAWNEFPFVLAFTEGPSIRTLPYQLYLLRTTEGIENWPMVMAFVIITVIPIVLVYLRFEKHVVNSMTSGALK